jgi:membrane fusion protein (multidrug efflux system)
MTERIETTEAPAAPKAAPGGRKVVVRVILGIAAELALGAGINRWLWNQTHVTTENAEIGGDVVPALARVSGYVSAVAVDDNQAVKAGDPIVLLDDREQKAKLAQAEGDYAAALAMAGAKNRPGQADAQLAAARAQVAQAEANATRAHADAERYRALSARSVVSRQQLDAAVAADQAAAAQLDASRKQVLASQSALLGADARLQAAKAMRDQAALTLSYTRIVAPISGVVAKRNVKPGQYVQAGQALLAVVPLDDLYVIANLKETEIEHVRIGDEVKVTVDAYPGHPVHGKVESFSPATGASFSLLPPDNATGNYTHVVQHIPVRIRIDGNGEAQKALRRGMSVQVTITTRKG